jgi:plasmid stabilization system protein ParE
MGKYKLELYSLAKTDLKDLVGYLNTLAPQDAIKYYDPIVAEIYSLAEMPKQCSFVQDIVLKAKGYRYLIADSYIVYFVVKPNTVQIRRILYCNRNYQGLM